MTLWDYLNDEARYTIWDDPKDKPPVARCSCCGGEIYSEWEYDEFDGLCEECYEHGMMYAGMEDYI